MDRYLIEIAGIPGYELMCRCFSGDGPKHAGQVHFSDLGAANIPSAALQTAINKS